MEYNEIENNEIKNFDLKEKWVLWFHKLNDNDWSLKSYSKVFEISTYHDLLLVLKEIDNITAGMFFLMKNGINPVYEDERNCKGGYWSMRITKKDSHDFWEKILYYICVDNLTNEKKFEDKINGISIGPKINNCIFKIWTSDFKGMNTKNMRHDLPFINWSDSFYLEHS